MRLSFLASATSLALIAACGGGGEVSPIQPELTPNTTTASFALIQSQILTPSCATVGCHAGSSPQGGLALTPDVAYQQLVGALPMNSTARADGLRRVVAFKPDSSLLYHKLIFPPGHHAHDYGNPMPTGTAGLSIGQIEYVRQWIASGAPKTGVTAEPTLLNDRTPQTTLPFAGLAAPAPGAGIQLHVDRFDVTSNFERELFTYKKLLNVDPLYVSRIQTSMRPFSHHFVLYTFNPGTPAFIVPQANAVRDIRNPDGTMNVGNMLAMGYHVFFAGAMSQQSDYSFPPGTALKIPADGAIDLNVHYANKTATSVPGEAYVNLYTVPASQVVHPVSTLNLSNTAIALPASRRTTLEKTFLFTERTTVIALTSHMHARGERFVIKVVGGARDGEVVYDNSDWEHPQITSYAAPIVLEAGQGLKSVVTWNNTTASNIAFGLTSDQEMDIIFGYYY